MRTRGLSVGGPVPERARELCPERPVELRPLAVDERDGFDRSDLVPVAFADCVPDGQPDGSTDGSTDGSADPDPDRDAYANAHPAAHDSADPPPDADAHAHPVTREHPRPARLADRE